MPNLNTLASKSPRSKNTLNPWCPWTQKKKELVGEFKNAGQEWQPAGEPEEVQVYDFLNKELGKAIPYGVYDLASNEGW